MSKFQSPAATPLAADNAAAPITRAQWLALTAALLGWMFDGAEMGVFSMVGRSALMDLFGPDVPETTVGLWFGVITAGFLVGAATGGVLFGWLGDRIGRVRAMTLSVITYAVFTGLCGFVSTPWQLGVLRFIAALGMGGEWSLGVALVMEVWPNRSRALMAGLIGAAANVGYLIVGLVGLVLTSVLADLGQLLTTLGLPEDWVALLVRNKGWRILMIFGAAPALLTFLIRLFVPESHRWQQEQLSGATSSWATRDLLAVLLGALGPAMIIYIWTAEYSAAVRLLGSLLGLLIAAAGYTYPVIRYLQRQNLAAGAGVTVAAWQSTIGRMLLAAGLSGVALLGTWASVQWAPSWAGQLSSDPAESPREMTQICLAVGAIVGVLAAALAGDYMGRRWSYVLLCLLSFGSVLLLYQGNTAYGPQFLVCAFLAGVSTAAFYGWLPLYLPELFPTAIRATGQGFGFNFGRILAAVGALQTGNLTNPVKIGEVTYGGGYPFACSAMSAIYLVGIVLIWFAPETKGRPLPD